MPYGDNRIGYIYCDCGNTERPGVLGRQICTGLFRGEALTARTPAALSSRVRRWVHVHRATPFNRGD